MTKAAIDKLQPAAEDSDSDLEVIYTVCTFMPVCSDKIRTATPNKLTERDPHFKFIFCDG